MFLYERASAKSLLRVVFRMGRSDMKILNKKCAVIAPWRTSALIDFNKVVDNP